MSRHLRLDHTPTDDEEQLTVDDILAARAEDEPPPAPAPERQTRVQQQLGRPWLVAVGVWLAALYGLSYLGIGLATPMAWSLVVAVIAALVVVRAWARSELQLQQTLRRRDRPPL